MQPSSEWKIWSSECKFVVFFNKNHCFPLGFHQSFINKRVHSFRSFTAFTDHDIDINYVQILEKNVNNWCKRIFLESWHSTKDKIAVNERKPFPLIYKTLKKIQGEQRVDWLGNLMTFFVISFCFPFPYWNMTLIVHK